jgi:DNA helicase-2/ATP-dependent DNA helicase PcrA
MLHGQSRYPIRSRFIDEIPNTLVRILSATVKPVPQASPRRAPWLDEVAAPAVSVSLQGFRIGQGVSHAKFGSGVVINAEGSGSDVRLQINFAEHGLKWLDLRYAKLTAE